MKLNPKLVIFDMDGLLFDTEELTYSIFERVCKRFGLVYERAAYAAQVGINRADRQIFYREYFGPDANIEEMLNVVRFESHAAKHQGQIELKPGVLPLLNHLKAKSIRMAVSSSTIFAEVEYALKSTKLFDYFDDVIGGDMLERGKPHPDAFLLPCQRCNINPSEALVLEDSQAGIQSAWAAGIPVICVPDMQVPDENHRSKTVAVLEDLSQVIAIL